VIAVAADATPDEGRDTVQLRFAPADTTITAGTTGRLAIVLDEAITVRTLDVTVAYDTTVIRTAGWEAGRIFTDPGLFLFDGFEEDTPGVWHAYVIVMGADIWAEGPGDLFYWDFEGVADGVTSVEVSPTPPDTVGVFLSNAAGVWYDLVVLPGTTVTVGDTSPVWPEIAPLLPSLDLWPNPFNPQAALRVEIDRPGHVYLAVYDAAGRRLRTLHDGHLPAGPATWTWSGRDDRGCDVPSGVYLFRLRTPGGVTATRGTLLK
jgi:hypothetical protein